MSPSDFPLFLCPKPRDKAKDNNGGNMNLRSASISTRRTSRGFTLIELLVVIGILLILISLFAVGANYVTLQLKIRSTKATLEIAKQMWANYQQATSLQKPIPTELPGTTPIYTNYPGAPSSTPNWLMGQDIAAGAITPDYLQLSNANRTGNSSYPFGLPNEVANTELVMQALLTVPQNQTLLNNIPGNSVIRDADTYTGNCALLLDGWGNPILFVPGGGLTGVWVDYSQGASNQPTITSEGNVYPAQNQTPAMNAHPFFVSAGPDGDVSNAHGWTAPAAPNSSMVDDNIYSFQN